MTLYVSTCKVATLLGVSHRSVGNMADAGILPCHRVGRRRDRRFALETLRDFCAEHRIPFGSKPTVRMEVVQRCLGIGNQAAQALFDGGTLTGFRLPTGIRERRVYVSSLNALLRSKGLPEWNDSAGRRKSTSSPGGTSRPAKASRTAVSCA